MNFKVGWITEAVWDKNVYRVQFRDQYDAYPAKRLDTGVNEPLNIDDYVLCLYTKEINWVIVGRLPTPEKYAKEDDAKSEEQRLLEEHRKLIGEYVAGVTNAGAAEKGSADDGIPNFYREDEEPAAFGDAVMRSRESGAFVRADSSGAILAVVSNILCTIMDSFKGGLLQRCSQYILDVIPGFRFKISSEPDQNAPKVPSQATSSTKPKKMKIEGTLASDPGIDRIDFDFEAGALRDIDDPLLGQGRASDTKPYRMKRGLRTRFGDFGVFEIDNDKDELRISFTYGADPKVDMYQMRFNPKEATLSWGLDQFISLTDDGLLIKAKSIGLAGPLVMWDPLKTATFMHNQDITKTDWAAVIRWDNTKTEPGLRIDKSIYFGEKGDPAITKPYIDTVLKLALTTIDSHIHSTSSPGAPTGPMNPPVSSVVNPFLSEPLVDTFLTIVKKPATPAP